MKESSDLPNLSLIILKAGSLKNTSIYDICVTRTKDLLQLQFKSLTKKKKSNTIFKILNTATITTKKLNTVAKISNTTVIIIKMPKVKIAIQIFN